MALLLGVLLVGPAAGAGNAKVKVTVGQSVTHWVKAPIKTVSIADSKVADVVVANDHEILVNGKAIGFTTLVVWGESGGSDLYDVVVRGPFSDEQIELRVKVVEVNRTKAMERGFDFLFRDKNSTAGVYGGQVAPPGIPMQIFEGATAEGASMALRWVRGGVDVSSMIHMLQTEGLLRVLAEPNVVASSGQSARFLSGGEIPVPVASAGTQGGTNITIQWKEYGVKVEFVPTIVDSGIINLQVAPEVSSIDLANSVILGGFRVPALRVRRAGTTVELMDGEVLVIGGLIMEEQTKLQRRIPILGHLPLLGYFFGNSQTVTNQSELLLVVSPHIVHAQPEGTTIQLPGVGTKDKE